jgi:hypothetical protein
LSISCCAKTVAVSIRPKTSDRITAVKVFIFCYLLLFCLLHII